MLRISWPLALLLAATIAIVARKPRMLPWLLIAYGVWFLVETARRKNKDRDRNGGGDRPP